MKSYQTIKVSSTYRQTRNYIMFHLHLQLQLGLPARHVLAKLLRIILQTVFATGYDREAGVIALPGESHFSSPEQLMSQQPWPQNGCRPAMEVSRHPDNQVRPSEDHQPAQQSQRSGFSPPSDLSVELIRCSGNRFFFFFFCSMIQTADSRRQQSLS